MECYTPGFRNSSKTFQALMTNVLWERACTQTHIKMISSVHIRDVLDRLRLANLTARVSKTQFAKEETKCLGFVVGNGTITPDID